jgi:uracil-DNA glycosylase
MISAYDTPQSNSLFSEVRTLSELVNFHKFLETKEEQPFNIGIDLPIYFGDPSSNHKIMIVAMDPKRTGQEPGVYSLGSVFSLHTNEGRSTKKNDYWKFIEPMISENFVYLTDIYKLYYESFSEVNGRKTHVVSNKDKSFIRKDTVPFKINKQILDAEINIVQPTKIIALGKEAANALKLIKGIKNSESEICFNQEGIEYVFMPHIARTVTQNISTIANLFVAMGKIKNDKQMENIGNQIKKYKGDLFL